MPSTHNRTAIERKSGRKEDQLQNQTDLSTALTVLSEINYVSTAKNEDGTVEFETGLPSTQEMKRTTTNPADTALREEYWGRPDPTNAQAFQIGWWGKSLALLLLRCAASTVAQQGSFRSDTFAKQIVRCWNKQFRGPGEKLSEDVTKETPISFFFVTSAKTREAFPKGDGERYFRAIAWYCATQIAAYPRDDVRVNLDKHGLYAAIVGASATPAPNPEAFFWSLCAALDVKDTILDTTKPSQGLLDPRFLLPRDQGEAETDTTLRKIAAEILDGFSSTAKPTRMIGLSGNPHAGKKTVIAEFCGMLLDKASETVEFKSPVDGRAMSVIGINLRTRNYADLIQTVHNRLCRVAKEKETDKQYDVAQLMKRIASKFRDRPALFIFVDVDGIGHDDPRRILQKRGFRRLLTALRDANHANRFLVTSSEMDVFVRDPVLRNALRWINVPDPTIRRLKWYLTGAGEKWLDELIVTAKIQNREQQLSGDGLVAIAALEPSDPRSYDGEFLETINTYVKTTMTGRAMGVDYAFDQLINRFDDQGILPAMALIALSYDGLGEYSLRRCLEWWARQAPEDHRFNPENDAQHDAILACLKGLGRLVRGLVIQFGPSVNHEPDEFGFDEVVTSVSDGRPNTWAVQANVAHEILCAIARRKTQSFDGGAFIRHGQRTIAFAARRRAQFKKMRSKSDDPFFANSGTGRDVQSYVALLGSINWQALDKPDPKMPPSGHVDTVTATTLPVRQLRRVFCIDKSMFAPRKACVFAVQSILMHDVDFDHRLSLVTDQDSLRLSLYLLPFICASRRNPLPITARALTGMKPVDFSNLDIPVSLVSVLGPDTVTDMLSTIAVTAYYCLDIPALTWAAQQIPEILGGDPKMREVAMARALLAMIDASLLLGHWAFESMDERFFKTEKPFEPGFEGIAQRLPGIYKCIRDTKFDAPPPTDKFMLKVWARFKVREIELKWHLDQNPQEAIKTLLGFEKAAARLPPFGSVQLISGRSARKLMRVLANETPIWSPLPPFAASTDQRELIRSLLEVTISSLVRRAGAERVGVLLDQARLYLLDNEDIGRVKSVMNEAWERADNGSVSAMMRMELMAMDSAITLIDLKNQRKSTPRNAPIDRQVIETAKETLQSLREMADSFQLKPLSMAACNLERLWVVEISKAVSREEIELWPIDHTSAEQIAEKLIPLRMKRVIAALTK